MGRGGRERREGLIEREREKVKEKKERRDLTEMENRGRGNFKLIEWEKEIDKSNGIHLHILNNICHLTFCKMEGRFVELELIFFKVSYRNNLDENF